MRNLIGRLTPTLRFTRTFTRTFGLVLALQLALITPAQSNTVQSSPLAGARQVGEGALRWFGIKIYDAKLWALKGFESTRWNDSSFALDIRYARSLSGKNIAEKSHDEMIRLGFGRDAQRSAWLEWMSTTFPDVNAGDRLIGIHLPGAGVKFSFNGVPLRESKDPEFSQAFFSIWLDPRTAAPSLRTALFANESGL
jgi:Chalcone isomerase-like